MGYIKHLISPQAFEVIRDRIGEILTDEFDNSFIWSYNTLFNDVKVWRERFIQLDKSECPAVNVGLLTGDYGNKNQGSVDGEYNFAIDVYTNSADEGGISGDTLAAVKNQTLIGAIRAILEDNVYRTLRFNPGLIARTGIQNFKMADITEKKDGLHTCMSRIIFKVLAPESTLPIPADVLAGYVTQVKLHETEKGFYWGGE